MTDKQIIIDGTDIPSKNNKYRLGRTKIERQQIFEDIKEMIENGFSLQNIADKYGVTRQAISLKMINCGFNVSQEVKRIKREKIKKLLEETSVNNVEKLNRKVKYYKTYNIRLRNDLTELKEKLSRKEQECKELRTERKNLKWDLENNIQVKNHAREEIDQLKKDNKHLNDLLNQALKELEQSREAIGKIKDIAENVIKNVSDRCIETTPMYGVHKQILQICDEVNDV